MNTLYEKIKNCKTEEELIDLLGKQNWHINNDCDECYPREGSCNRCYQEVVQRGHFSLMGEDINLFKNRNKYNVVVSVLNRCFCCCDIEKALNNEVNND